MNDFICKIEYYRWIDMLRNGNQFILCPFGAKCYTHIFRLYFEQCLCPSLAMDDKGSINTNLEPR